MSPLAREPVAMKVVALLSALCVCLTLPARADEGLWLFNQPPLKQLRQRYGFEPTPQWLEHLQKSCLRVNVGGSGAFVSAQGLVMTNHHVAADAIQKLSGANQDLIKTGFYAPRRELELKCQDVEMDQLESVQDVTPQIQAALVGLGPEQAEATRRAAINKIEADSLKATGLKSEVVTLYRGGAYQLYGYHRYEDVRLVFAPELDTAFFGGDADNFEYPRHCLDVAFFRVYDSNGQPLRPQHFLQWGEGVKEGDLVLVGGNPARTDRLDTLSYLKSLRDQQYPTILDCLRRLEITLNTFAERSVENARQTQDDLFRVQNYRKDRIGALQGLQDPAVMRDKATQEGQLRQAVAGRPDLLSRYGDAWSQVEGAVQELSRFYERYYLLEMARGFDSRLFDIARDLVRYVTEKARPDDQRLREYAESHWESLLEELFSAAPLYKNFELAKFSDSLGLVTERLGEEDPLVVKILAGQSPRQRAYDLIFKTQLDQVSYRRQVARMSPAELQRCGDPMIELALALEPESRRLRSRYDEKVASPMQTGYGKIAQARLALSQEGLYPDATFTLRLAFGKVAGYQEEGQTFPYATTLQGLFTSSAAHANQPPFKLPASWEKARNQLKLDTPFNFVCTADIVGGNSGSPVVNRQGQVVGLIFDGNLASLILDFVYSEIQARALAVDVRAITEALNQVYHCPALVEELHGH